jgi:hypothetical protein
MTVLAAPAGLVRVSAPLPIPRQYTLLDAARAVVSDSERWLAGQSSEGYVPGKASVFDHCSHGSDRIKDAANLIPVRRFGAFTVYLVGQCTSVSIGPDPAYWTDRLQLAFEAVEAEAVERVFATADGNAAFGPYLNDANLKILDGTGVPAVEGLAQLEQEIADKGGGGIIHATPAVATYWASLFLIASKAGVMYTQLGTRVAVGAGYIDVATSSGAGEEWAYATGPVEFTRDPNPVVIPADYSQALDRSNNDVLYIAEREYVLNWVGREDPSDEHHIQAGVLIDRALT